LASALVSGGSIPGRGVMVPLRFHDIPREQIFTEPPSHLINIDFLSAPRCLSKTTLRNVQIYNRIPALSEVS